MNKQEKMARISIIESMHDAAYVHNCRWVSSADALRIADAADARIAALEKDVREASAAILEYVETVKRKNARIIALEAALTDYIRETGIGSTMLPKVTPPESGTMAAKIAALEAEVASLREALKALVNQGSPHENPDCPCDNTCECKVAAMVNAALKKDGH